MTQDEAARDLGWSLMTVRRRLEQGRELLRSRLTTRGMTLSAALAAGGLVQESTGTVSTSLRQRAIDVVSGGTISPRVLALVPTPSGTRMVILLAAGTVAAIGLGFGAIMAFMPKPAKPTSPVVVAPEAPVGESAPATVCFSPDGSLLAVGTVKVRLFSARTGQLLETFDGHRGVIKALLFDAKNERLISGSEDTTAVVWRLSKR